MVHAHVCEAGGDVAIVAASCHRDVIGRHASRAAIVVAIGAILIDVQVVESKRREVVGGMTLGTIVASRPRIRPLARVPLWHEAQLRGVPAS